MSPHYHEIIGSLTYTLSQYGIHLLLAQCGGQDTDPVQAMEKIARTRSCDGMVITDMRPDDVRPQILEETGLPFVVRGSSPQTGVVAVGMDNVAVGYEAVKHLYSLGHRRILFYNIGRDLMSGLRRFEGFCLARDEFGLGDQIEYRDDSHHENGVYESLRERLQRPSIPTAIFAEDEMGAFGAQRALAEAGLRVPEDVSVMTCLNARFHAPGRAGSDGAECPSKRDRRAGRSSAGKKCCKANPWKSVRYSCRPCSRSAAARRRRPVLRKRSMKPLVLFLCRRVFVVVFLALCLPLHAQAPLDDGRVMLQGFLLGVAPIRPHGKVPSNGNPALVRDRARRCRRHSPGAL